MTTSTSEGLLLNAVWIKCGTVVVNSLLEISKQYEVLKWGDKRRDDHFVVNVDKIANKIELIISEGKIE